MSYNFVVTVFTQRNSVEDFLQAKCDFRRKTCRCAFSSPPPLLGGLGVEVCGMTFLFPFPSHSYRIIPISIPTYSHSNTAFPFPFFPSPLFPFPHSHSHFRQRLYIDYLKAKKYVYCVVNSEQNMKLQQKHC